MDVDLPTGDELDHIEDLMQPGGWQSYTFNYHIEKASLYGGYYDIWDAAWREAAARVGHLLPRRLFCTSDGTEYINIIMKQGGSGSH